MKTKADELLESIQETLERLGKMLKVLALFLVWTMANAMLALVTVLPFALRGLFVLAWIAAMGLTLIGAWQLYSIVYPSALPAAIVAAMFTGFVAVIPSQFGFNDAMFGGYLLAALLGIGLWALCGTLADRIDLYAIISIAPNTLAVVGIIALAMRKQEEKHGNRN